MMNRFRIALLALLLGATQAFAGAGSIGVTPGSGATIVTTTDGSGFNLSHIVTCDQSAGANCTSVKAASTAAVAGDQSMVVTIHPSTAAMPVTGTFWQATQPVSGTVTATQGTAAGSGPWIMTPWIAGAVNSATNGTYSNTLQGNAALSATNGLYSNLLQGNAALSTSNPVPVQSVPGSTGGQLIFFLQPTASTNATNIKNAAGNIYSVVATNNSATINYLRFYNLSSAPTCSSATGFINQIAIPASTSGAGFVIPIPEGGWSYGTGIGICVTSGYSTTDTTNATASAISITVGYK